MHSIKNVTLENNAYNKCISWFIKTCSLQMDLLETQWGTINMDNQQEPPVYHRKLYTMFCDDLYVKRMWKKKLDICITESLS